MKDKLSYEEWSKEWRDSTRFFQCDCTAEAICVQADPEFPYIYAEFWVSGPRGAYGWPLLTRLKRAWQWLRNKPEPVHGLVYEPEQARALGEYLLELAEKKGG